MQIKRFGRLLVFASMLMTFNVFATSHEEHVVSGNEEVKRKAEVEAVKHHHLLDDHSFNIVHSETFHLGFPLPVILWDNGLKVFLSSAFENDKHTANVGEDYYTLHHGVIYKTDSNGALHYEEGQHHPHNAKPFDLSITKSVVIIILMSIFMILVFRKIARSYDEKGMPTKAGRFLEPIIVFVRDDIAIPNIGKEKHARYMSYLLTVFFFIWFLNLAGMTPLGIGVTNQLPVTMSLALITFFITQFSGNKNYWGHIFWMPGVPYPMRILLAPIELLGIFIKPFALMIRLFANMTAGHVVLMSIVGLIYVSHHWFATGAFLSLATFLSVLELLVAALQAYIFTMLTALYFGSAVEEHH